MDTNVFKPIPGLVKDFDVVMVAAFAPWKRHATLFQAMRKLRPRRVRVALIGNQWEWTRAQFDEHIHRCGVEEDCTVFQGIAPEQVNEILNRSKVNVLLTKIEGGNRALFGSIVGERTERCLQTHPGPRHADINPLTGVFADDVELADVLVQAIENYKTFQPREWYLKNSGYKNSSQKLNETLRRLALERGEHWTRDIVEKVNRPDAEYADKADAATLRRAWSDFEKFVCDLG